MNKSTEYSPGNQEYQSDILKQALVDILCDSNFDDEKGYQNSFHPDQENLEQNNTQQQVALEGSGQQNDVNDTFTVEMNAQPICYLRESLNADSKPYTISHNGSSVPTSHQLVQFKAVQENATAASLSMETIQDSRKLQSSVKSNHGLQHPFQGSQVTTPETCEQYAIHNKKSLVAYHLVNNKNLIVKSTTMVQQVDKSTFRNAANVRSARKNVIVNNNTTPMTSGSSNAFLLPKTQTSIVNAPFSISLGVNSDASVNTIPNTTQKKSSKPTIRSNIKYKVPVSTIQGMLGVHQNSVLKTSFQHSLLKTQPGKTVTNGLPNSQLTNKLETKKIPMFAVDKVRLDFNNKLGRQSPGGLNGKKLSAIKPTQPAVSKSYSPIVPNSSGNLMPPNSPNPVEQHSQNVKIIVLQPSSQSGSVVSNLVSLKDWQTENIAKTHNVNFESTIEKLLTNHKPTIVRPKTTAKRGRPRKDSVRPLVTECKQPVSDEDMDEFRERVTRCGRLSRPPPHIINDYKHNHLTNLIHPDVDDSNGNVLAEGEASKELLPGLEGPKRNISDDFKCPTCKKIYLGRSKMAAHFEKNPTHGSVDQLPPPKLISLDSKKNNLKPKGKKRGPWVTPEEKSARRQVNLQKAISVCDKSEILKIAAKPVLEATSILDLMLIKSKNSVQNFFEVFNNFLRDVREKIVPDLQRMRDEDRGSANTIDLTQQFVCDAMGLSPGVYKFNNNILEGEEPLQDEEPPLKKFKGLSEEEEQHLLLDNRNSSEFSEGSDNSSNSNCVNYLSALPLMPTNSSPNNEVCKPIVISTPEIQAELSENSGFKKIDISANFNNSFEKMSESSQSLPIFSTLGCDFKTVAETLINETELESENSVCNESYQTIEDDAYIFSNVENSIGNMIGADTFTSDYKRSYNHVESGVNNNSMVKIF